ncbi:hypothetical protein PROFUN_15531 [Planoprotostelium fungivorum]|uniref:Uncharacterized protein n=1 Tax=Planoprotostelium fungivorum TaxID=1890364 RepID=A0A2P6MUW3_9EUKA|nr:hypothetical protein PROFUN_15531 [Planoprotostelium fungivorum]
MRILEYTHSCCSSCFVTALQWSSWRASSETGRPQQLGFQWRSNNLFQKKEYTLMGISLKGPCTRAPQMKKEYTLCEIPIKGPCTRAPQMESQLQPTAKEDGSHELRA